MNLTPTFKNKKVFLTGHTGFKGSWLSVWLTMMGAEAKGYALNPEKKSLYNEVLPQLQIDSVIADIRNKDKLIQEVIAFNPDFIFHLAAQPLVRESYKYPTETFDVNIIGTVHVLEALRFLKKKCICVIATTDKVYENLEKNYAYKESDKLGGHDPYSASKAAAEIVTSSYRLSFFNPSEIKKHKKSVATGRAGNVIGGGDYAPDRIMPDIFRSLSSSSIINVRNPKAIRPWQHVLEPLHGYLTLAAFMNSNPGRSGPGYNFGPRLNDTFTVEQLVKLAIECWGDGKYKLLKEKNAPHEAGLLKLNIQKAKQELNWHPKWKASTAIQHTVSWYKNNLKKNSNAFHLCEEDILAYLKK